MQMPTSQQSEPNSGDALAFNGTTKDDVNGLKYLYSAQNIIDESQSSKEAAAETEAEKVPMVGLLGTFENKKQSGGKS